MDVTPPDSAALRSHGAQLRAAAENVHAVAKRLERRTDAVDFRGPAADRMRGGMTDRISRLHRIEHELQDLAEIVVQDSGGIGTTS